MKITDIKIDGFGVWNNLQLERLSPQVTAFFGANEAGKTTLMQFIRSVLYGMTDQRRTKYLPPVNGGTPGGMLGIAENGQRLQVSRVADRGPDDFGLVTVTTAEGETSGDRLLRDMLAEVDEAAFNNVFAVGLSEIQQLGTLDDTKAAQWLYRLTSGLDRVSLYDVIQSLRQTRKDLLSGEEGSSRIAQLMNRREVLRGEIKQLVQRNRQWAQLTVRIQELDEQISEQEQMVRSTEYDARTIEIAVGVKSNWRRRAKLSAQIQQFVGNAQIPDDGVERLDELNKKIEHHQREADILQGQRRQLKEQSDRLGVNERLLKSCCRIDALGEQRDWLQSLERQVDDLEAEAGDFEQRLDNERQRLGRVLGVADREHLKVVKNADIEAMQPLVEEVRSAQKYLEQAEHDLAALSENERSLKVKIESSIVSGESHGLPMDVREASDLVAKLRRRLKVEQRIEQARNHELEIEQQSHELLEDQVMPLWLFNWSLAAVVLGGLLAGTWLWMPNSPFGGFGSLLALGGLAAGAFCFIFKFFTEDAAADKLDACQRQMETLAHQIEEAERDKKKLDTELPMTDGSVVIRLQAAERHLAELENVLPVEAQRKQAGHEVASASSRVEQARAELEKALDSWKTKLVGLGFSEELDPQRFLVVTERYDALGDLEERARLRREEVEIRRREHAALTRRVFDLAEEVDCLLEEVETEQGEAGAAEVDTLDQLEHLLAERRRQQADIERREELFEKAKQLKATEGKHRRAIVGLQRRRAALFQAVDCEEESAYRRLAQQQEECRKLRRQRKALSREIAAAIGQHAPEETFAELLTPDQIGKLDEMWENIQARLEEQQAELETLVDRRGALRQEQRSMAEDRSLAQRQLDLSCVEKQLQAARQSWREHAVISRVLERIRRDYEAHRQPETLAEASRYMKQLTGGEYLRVWTPLADDILLVENSAGQSLPVEFLSRGTREQLFLSVRLALVSTFARRGIRLPMVLDDVLVNFDAVRAQRAAEVLCQFAAGGHQLLVFTCHEHMWQMFKTRDADCRRLPYRKGYSGPIVEAIEDPVVEQTVAEVPKPKSKKRRKSNPHPVVKEQPVERSESPPVEYYDYPFTERIEQEVVEVPFELSEETEEVAFEPSQLEESPYSWEAPAKHEAGNDALAYIFSDENHTSAEKSKAEPNFYQRIDRDHLEPRRA